MKFLIKGQIAMIWPGLNTPLPLTEVKSTVKIFRLPEKTEEEIKAMNIKRETSAIKHRAIKMDPLDRGWAGTRLPGQKLGPPDPIGEGVQILQLQYIVIPALCNKFSVPKGVQNLSLHSCTFSMGHYK